MNVEITDHPAARAERCLGRLCAPATGLEFKQSDRGSGEFMITDLTTAAIERTLPEGSEDSISVTVGGGGTTVTGATLTTLGEFIERYSMYWPVENAVTETAASLQGAGESVVDLQYLQIWDEAALENAGFEWFDADTTTEWVPGTDLRTGQKIFVPAELVTFGHAHRDATSLPTSTSGNACGSSLAGAVARSLYEQVERDAVMRTWYEQRTPTKLDITGLERLERFRRRITPAGYQLHVVELPTPTDCAAVATMCINEADRVPKFRLFAGADRTLAGAIWDALSEAAEGMLQTKYRLAAGDTPDPDIDITNVYDFDGNVQYYMRPENFAAVAHLCEGDIRTVSPEETTDTVTPSDGGHWTNDPSSTYQGPSSNDRSASTDPAEPDNQPAFREPERELDRAVAAVVAGGDLTPIAVDLTPGDIRELGMYATAVYVPELVDIAPPALPPVDHPELSRVETRAPHPFP